MENKPKFVNKARRLKYHGYKALPFCWLSQFRMQFSNPICYRIRKSIHFYTPDR